MTSALDRDEFVVVYQPIVSLESYRIVRLRGTGPLASPNRGSHRAHPISFRSPRELDSSCRWALGCCVKPAHS